MRKALVIVGFFVVLVAAAWAFVSCGGGSGTTTTPAITGTDASAIRTAIKAANAAGFTPGQSFTSVTMPACTMSDSSTDITYSMTGLPSWLSFDATTRALTLANSATTVPSDALTADADVNYTCTSDTTSTETSSVGEFTINDSDGGGVVDGKEYAVPLLNNNGWFWLNAGTLNLYRVGTTSFKIPTGITKVATGMSLSDATDDVSDLDGDGTANNTEIATAGSNLFAVASSGGLGTDTDKTVGDTPYAIVAADFDGNGYVDLASTNSGAGTVSIFLASGTGTFADPVSSSPTVGTGPRGLVAAELNGDSYIDLAVVNSNSKTVSILINDGDGTFTAGAAKSTGTSPTGITAGDFDKDGDVDLVVTVTDDNRVTVFLGNGNGTFDDGTNYTTATSPKGVITADLNSDGKLDLAVATTAGVSILLGGNSGTFGSNTDYNTGGNHPALSAGDFNGDGYVDLVATNSSSAVVTIFTNNGSADFSTTSTHNASGNAVGKEQVLVVTDFNGDGYLDIGLVTSYTGHSTVYIATGAGTGVFTALDDYNDLLAITVYDAITAADFNKDGKIDVATLSDDGGLTLTMQVYLKQ